MVNSTSSVARPLLYEEDDSNSSNDEDDDKYYSKLHNHDENGLMGAVGTHYGNGVFRVGSSRQLLRRSRRLTRIIFICGAVLILLLLIYIPFSSIHSRLAALPGWGFNTSRNTADYILPDLDTTIIEPPHVCRSDFFLLVVVTSSIENFAARQAIRESWGNVSEFNYPLFSKMHSHLHGQYLDVMEMRLRTYAYHLNLTNVTNFYETSHNQNLPVRVVFLLGKQNTNKLNLNETFAKLRLESQQYEDIIQEDFLDTYNNLTLKSIMMLKWVTKKCAHRAKFLMKCDDDTFVNIPNLLHILLGGTVPVYNSTVEFYNVTTVNAISPSNRINANQNLLMGYKFCMVRPVADTTSKWYAPIYMYHGETYPNYLSGSSYVMSFDVIPKLYNVSLNTTILHLEDVYITGICAQKIHLQRRHHPLFWFNNSINKCSYKGIVSQHYVKGDLMRDIYNFVTNVTNRCPPPEKIFKGNRLKKRVKSCS